MRLVEPPAGNTLDDMLVEEPRLEYGAAFGPGRRYWTTKGEAIVTDRELLLVLPRDNEGRRRVALAASISQVTTIEKPRWSFGTGLFVAVGEDHYTVEPEPLYGRAVTPGRLRRAREAARELERALRAEA